MFRHKSRNLKFGLVFCFVITLSFININNHKMILASDSTYDIRLDLIDRSNWFWTDLDLISSESNDLSYEPQVFVDIQGNIHTLWEDRSDYLSCGLDVDIFYKWYNIVTKTWSATEVVSTESIDDSVQPDIVVDTGGNVHTIWKDISNYDGSGLDDDVFYKRKDANTGSWTSTLVLSYFSDSISLGPSICIDSEDNVHSVWFDFTNYQGSGIDGDLFYSVLDSETFQWSSIDVISTESTADSFYPHITADSEDNIHVSWGDYTDYLGTGSDADIFYKRWIKSVNYWTTTEVISAHSLNIDPSIDAVVEVADDGTVYVSWQDYSGFYGVGTDPDICLNVWDPILGEWSGAYIVSMYSSDYSYDPSLYVDYSGELHCVWMDSSDYAGSDTDFDIWYSSFDPISKSLSTPEVLTDNIDTSSVPNIVSDNKGFLYLVFSDSSYVDSGTDTDAYLMRYVSLPTAPNLEEIQPDPSETSSLILEWNNVRTASDYIICRYKGDLVSPSDLIAYDQVSLNSFTDTIEESGTYYYAIKSINEFGESNLSNIVNIEVNVEKTGSFLKSLDIIDFGILAALIIGVQIIFTTALYFSLKGKFTTKKRKKK
ncbi:MAG: hypothetical protein KAU62_08510 [Candidatus Heimdallarchaeota archaeon]|nr:hypothetical protein [Candidatus Heimdallarchaeota archaeon]MCG3256110.1 hypothetical protein [Candidatus Heimdallarchaeota archaeon]MCK4611180.1 hypothetical protein [Candidatus Heimdallarchaeota archaeon]